MIQPSESPPGDSPPAEEAPARRSAAQNALHLLLSQGLTFAMGMVLVVVQPRLLGVNAQGQLRLAGSITAITAVLVFFGTNQYLAIQVAQRGQAAAEELMSTVLVMRSILVVVSGGLGALYLLAIGVTRDTMIVYLVVQGSQLPVAVAYVARAILVGYENMKFVAVSDVVSKVVLTSTSLLVLFLGGGAALVAGCGILAAGLSAVLLWRYVRRFPGTRFRATLRRAPAILRASSGFLLGEIGLILYLQVDTVVMSALVGERELGWYSTADVIFSSLLFVPSILLSSLFPVIGRMHVEDPAGLDRLVERGTVTLLLAGVPLGLGLSVVAHPLVSFLYGAEFLPSADNLMLMGIVLVFGYCTILFGQVAFATGRTRLWNSLMFAGIACSVPLDIVLVPFFDERRGNGSIAGAVSYLFTEGLMFAVGLWKVAPGVLRGATGRRLLKIALSGALMALAAYPLRSSPLAVPVAAGAFVYVAAIVGLRALGPDERAMIARITDRLGGLTRRRPGGVSGS